MEDSLGDFERGFEGFKNSFKNWVFFFFFLKLHYDPTASFLGKYPEKTLFQKDTHTSMFIAALFTIAKMWKQPECPSAEGWIKKMWCAHTMACYPATEESEAMPSAAACVDLQTILLSKVSQTEANVRR